MPTSMRPPPKSMGKQIVLPWSQAAGIALESMRVRFGRSLITASSIALACAFLVFILVKQDFLEFLRALDTLMREAHGLELYRTTEQLHRALNTARAEVWEVIPHDSTGNHGTVDFVIGPIREQRPGG